MGKGISAADRSRLALGSIVLAAVFFFALNALSGPLLKTARLDLTADRLFTVSDGTRQSRWRRWTSRSRRTVSTA